MSLIGDALRKARQETADRESERQGILFSAKIADSPSRSNLGLGLALGAMIAVIATVAGGVAVWWVLGNGETPQSELSPGTTAVATELADPAGVVEPPTAQNAQVAEPTRTSSAADIPLAPSTNRGPGEIKPDPPRAQDTAIETSSSATLEDTGRAGGYTGTEDGNEIYILEADLGKVRLSLDFIISRADDPFCEINGIELHIGGVIEGYRVKEIENDRVLLSNGRRSVVLRAP